MKRGGNAEIAMEMEIQKNDSRRNRRRKPSLSPSLSSWLMALCITGLKKRGVEGEWRGGPSEKGRKGKVDCEIRYLS